MQNVYTELSRNKEMVQEQSSYVASETMAYDSEQSLWVQFLTSCEIYSQKHSDTNETEKSLQNTRAVNENVNKRIW